ANQGFDGDTEAATVNPIQFLQGLTPAGQEKLQIGQNVPVTWRSGGIYGPAGYYSSEVLADNPVAYYRLGEANGLAAAADASGHGFTGSYGGGVTFGQAGAMPSELDTSAQFEGKTGYVQLPAGFASFQ